MEKKVEKEKKIKKENFKKAITKSVLKNSLTATAWVFSTVFELGEITISSFLSPSLYADLPSGNPFAISGTASNKRKSKFKEITIRQSIRRLRKHGFVEEKNSKYILTAKGQELAKFILGRKKSQTKKWDGKYRVVIFDIPENKNRVRNWLREELYVLGYKKLQNSVLIGKDALPDDLVLEIKKQKVGNCVNYLLVDKVYKNIF
ncbi:MAG: Repressor in ring oxydation complex/ phenylacetic acid degradation pathway related protein (PaaX) [Candidatus Moranbacteria bacterium GW2011_GWC2_37_73]|nr:MAG: phenylacetic acid degradation operon negative regulatory protein, phenylacetic acid degradation operon negative regulatory protein [Parcubacteria group bacterium GW2011_GWC1_36_108]KKQ00031.1 MAG: Repressor in ring oxydation complex/ phenylacetic acid degradation pathway related protein (PaaX) [Candidatus Moranbacteria bacterium GW2011_GWD1_36_198]KKQ00297.1 MAG: Repressor in ring oxydation complex/ phenylacetic acid degradation pathway related protein (PaaX) [Candidatus Moranbacteria bac